jgi:hypothetical protein
MRARACFMLLQLLRTVAHCCLLAAASCIAQKRPAVAVVPTEIQQGIALHLFEGKRHTKLL